MKAKLLLALIFGALTSSGQELTFRNCSAEIVFELAEVMPMPVGGKDSLLPYFQKSIEKLGLAKSTSKVDIKIMIDKEGKACLGYVYDSPDEMLPEELAILVADMPNWNAGTQNKHHINCWARLLLVIKSGKVTDIIYSTSGNKSLKF